MYKKTISSAILGISFLLSFGYNVYQSQEYTQRLSEIESEIIVINSQSMIRTSLIENAGPIGIDYTPTEIASIASQSVVGIEIKYEQNVRWGKQTETITQTSSGSGIIFSIDGYIVTNYHVLDAAINNATPYTIIVYFNDGSSNVATYVNGDEVNDLALIKVDREDCVPAQFGNSDELKLGEFAMAIGYPLGTELAGSVTVGVISGMNRDISEEPSAYDLIQTDASINPGNSGGALVNANAEVIGINTSKIASTDVEGIGFAIPINEALSILEKMLE